MDDSSVSTMNDSNIHVVDTVYRDQSEPIPSTSYDVQLFEGQSQICAQVDLQPSKPIPLSTTRILDGTFFKLISFDSKNVIASCVVCLPKNVNIKGSVFSSSNFKTHLKRVHDRSVLYEYENYIVNPRKSRKGKMITSHDTNYKRKKKNYTQEQFDEDIINYIIHAVAPFSTLKNPFFEEIFIKSGILDNNRLTLMSPQSLTRKIESNFNTYVEKIKSSLEKVNYLCTTADVWSAQRKSFMCVTVHWIDEDSLERKTASLACRRFRGALSQDKFANILHGVYYKYNLNAAKIIATVIDSNSNMVKAFKVFGGNMSYFEELSCSKETDENDSDLTVTSFQEYSGNLENEPYVILSGHTRCCAHTLSLCLTIDITKTIQLSPHLYEIHTQVMQKCNILWNAASQPKSADVILSVLGHTLSRPDEARWNSLFDWLSQINKIKEKSSELNRALNLNHYSFTTYDHNYIEEFLSCVKPLLQALDIIQDDKSVFYGMIFPTLLCLQQKLMAINSENFTYCKLIRNSLLASLERRFSNILNLNTIEADNAAIAAFSHPKFKKKWLNYINISFHEKFLFLFKNKVSAIHTTTSGEDFEIEEDSSDFFYFGSMIQNGRADSTSAEIEVLKYFEDPRQCIESLNSYPTVKKVFLQYNTPVASSATVDRIFSFTAMSNLPNSNKLSDDLFEQKVILKSNLNNQLQYGK
ncbi:Ribonuclease H-like domain [Cinara cedri]|uniref:Ribonuclease H-like domain n=1 Tax=Cinara cedri TaxID=506608 RepID=A0A5E4MED3_9HEMI|nr:Ribonuclease H-like domain [Cinara cedri]